MGYVDLNTSKRHDWRTPEPVLELARAWLGGAIGLDPATAADNPTKADRIYDGEAHGDGLLLPWDAPWWCNPTFGQMLPAWAERAACVEARGLLLTPARVDTRWWGRIYETADCIGFWKGRMKFSLKGVPVASPAPFPVQIACYCAPDDSDQARSTAVRAFQEIFGSRCNGFASRRRGADVIELNVKVAGR